MPQRAVVCLAEGVGVLSQLAATIWEGGVLGPLLPPVGEVRNTPYFPLPKLGNVVGDGLADDEE